MLSSAPGSVVDRRCSDVKMLPVPSRRTGPPLTMAPSCCYREVDGVDRGGLAVGPRRELLDYESSAAKTVGANTREDVTVRIDRNSIDVGVSQAYRTDGRSGAGRGGRIDRNDVSRARVTGHVDVSRGVSRDVAGSGWKDARQLKGA